MIFDFGISSEGATCLIIFMFSVCIDSIVVFVMLLVLYSTV
ncbi:putative membrane protein [Ehrlichia chaffeensis str. Heartland]|nr:putative membrane protein [Ehrlichia chaffeensis str. Heartland]AHX05699.1 putative membrane protein [Ehrlichia chaffeensis str. Jax]AHX06691.1 putative membrane protein [Ehrlichia chaffeensis str. Liberty]AHX07277.1 putative membrane protein [Ehrlichia chaffeensis str. Osceola]AHX08981.1 putative membrane protein [Ehrlichia chaffeensis str. Saint Vincent]AHX09973.1 putative membrane protein [Ehrlichia chaffeensis str. Wakulla]AHX10322.1 putative membrane protein [Ehrlichia chaffeensis str